MFGYFVISTLLGALCAQDALAGETQDVIVATDIQVHGISSGQAVLLEELSRVSLEHYHTEWWDTLPFMRRISPFASIEKYTIDKDAANILYWMADHGWRDAVISYDIEEYSQGILHRVPKKYTAKKLVYKVYLGEIWKVDGVDIYGMDGITLQSVPHSQQLWSRNIQKNIDAEIQTVLGKQGYAFPKVQWQSSVVDTNTIHLEGYVEKGHVYQVSDIVITDSQKHMDYTNNFISQNAWNGERFDLYKIRLLQHRLAKLDNIEEVDYILEKKDTTDTVQIQYVLRTPQRFSVQPIFGLSSQATTWAVDTGIQWKVNSQELGGAQLQGTHILGYRAFPQLHIFPLSQSLQSPEESFNFHNHGINQLQAVEIRKGILPSTGISLVGGASVQRDIQKGYVQNSQEYHLGFRYHPLPKLQIDITHKQAKYDYLAIEGLEDIYEKWFGQQAMFPSQSTQRQMDVNLQILHPKQFLLTVQTSPIVWIEDSTMSRVYIQSEYRTQSDKWMRKFKGQAGGVFWHGEEVETLQNRFFLGGGRSLRGWGYRMVGVPGYDGAYFDVATGGEKLLSASAEFRYQLYPRYNLIAFTDVGRIWSNVHDPIHRKDWLPSVGTGFMIPTMAGDVLFLYAWQLQRDQQMANPPSMSTFHVLLGRELGK